MKSSDRQRRKSALPKPLLVFIVVVLGVGLVAGGALAIRLRSLTRDTVPIVTKPTESNGPAATTTEPTETLPVIEGTPDDIDVDYDVDVKDPIRAPIYERMPVDKNVVNILVLSSDARPGETTGRSDSMMLMSYNRKLGTLKLTSFMRDMWVRIEGRGWNRINAAYAFGGIGLAVNTVNDNFDLDIQYYVTVRFEQFIQIIDQIGGISLSLTRAEIDYINRANPENLLSTGAGVKQLTGAQALAHSRNRSVGNGDFDRTRRQRETMYAALQKLRQQRDPVKITRIVNDTLDHVTTNMKASTVIELAIEALGNDKLTFEDARVPFDKTWQYANEGGRSVIAIDLAKNRTLLHDFLYE